MRIFERLQSFVKRSIIGGLLVVAPFLVIWLLFKWLFNFVTNSIQPVISITGHYFEASEFTVDMIALGVIIIACFLIGTAISTTAGRIFHSKIDQYATRFAPGYRIIKDILSQFFGNKEESALRNGTVVIAQIFGSHIPTRAIGILTDELDNGWLTIFVPTAPNFTSGFIYIVPPECCEKRPEITLDQALKTVVAVGAGSNQIRNQSIQWEK